MLLCEVCYQGKWNTTKPRSAEAVAGEAAQEDIASFEG